MNTRTLKPRTIRSKFIIKVLLVIMLLLISGIIYEQVCRYIDAKNYPAVGEIVNVNGHNMHIWTDGEGDTTVVFGVGYQMPSGYVDFYPLYSEISKYARVAIYDRPGYGWSETTNAARDIDTITEEIHELLVQSGQKPPYIYVAHSIAALEAIRFAQLYGDEVKGIILIDGSNPDMYSNMEVLPSQTFAYKRSVFTRKSISALNNIGVLRLLFNTVYPYESSVLSTGRNGMPSVPAELKKIDQSLIRNFNNKNQIEESEYKEKNAFKTLEGGYLGDIPLRIITSEEFISYEDTNKNQTNLLKWSTDSTQVIVDNSKHAIHWYNPDVVNTQILEVLNKRTE